MPCDSSSCSYYKVNHPRRWILATVLTCLYGFLKAMRPSEPFLTPYLIQDKNLTEEQVDNEVYPYWTYSYMMALVPVFLFTDILRYKAVIVFEAVTYMGTWAILLWGFGVAQMKIMQLIYGLATATEIAYYAYIFAAVPKEKYQQVSSYTRSAILAGKFVAGVLGQLLISLKVTTYFGLNIISLTSVCCSLVVALGLPTVRRTLYFHREDGEEDIRSDVPSIDSTDEDSLKDGTSVPQRSHMSENPTNATGEASVGHHSRECDKSAPCGCDPKSVFPAEGAVVQPTHHLHCPHHLPQTSVRGAKPADSCRSFANGCRENFSHMWSDIKSCYGDFHLLKWSLWWAFATCGDFQVGNYIQNLWVIIYNKPENDDLDTDLYNGAVEAVSTLCGALFAFLIMFVHIDWRLFGELLLGVVSLMEAALLVVMGVTSNIWLCYAFYILFRSSYQLVITIATYQIAKFLAIERYALVFGINMFIAMVLGSIVTFIVVDSRTLDTPADTQFIIYGGYFLVLSCAFCSKAVYSITKYGWRAAWHDRLERATPSELVPSGEDENNRGSPTEYQQFYNDSENESDV